MNNNEEVFYREIFNKTNKINKSFKKIFDKEELKRFSSLIWENIKNEFENCNKNLNDLIIRMRFDYILYLYVKKRILRNLKIYVFLIRIFRNINYTILNQLI